MRVNSGFPLIRQILRVAVCACLVMMVSVPHAGAAGCTASIDLTLGDHAIKGEAPHGSGDQECGCQDSLTGTGNGDSGDAIHVNNCRRTEVHEDSEEIHMRMTTINSDGSENPQGEETRLTLKEGMMRQEEKDGGYGQFGGEWPDDEYTRHIPKPDMPLKFANINTRDHSFSAMFQKDTNRENNLAKMKAYVEKLKERGFTIDAKESDKTDSTKYAYYAYRAKNSAGYSVRVTCGGLCGLDLKKPQ